MTIGHLTLRLVRALVLTGVSAFFLLPFFPGIHALVATPALTVHAVPAASVQEQQGIAPSVSVDTATRTVAYTSENLGINLPWLDTHDGSQVINWLGAAYDPARIEGDLATIESLGVREVRTFCQLESLFDYRDGHFMLAEAYAVHLDDYLSRAQAHGISVICVMGAGNYAGDPQPFDGNFRWELVRTEHGRAAYRDALAAYVTRFRQHENIRMWQTFNEPYGELTWSPAASTSRVTAADMHTYLKMAYDTLKPLAGSTYVGFSDLEEHAQPKYRLFSDEKLRTTLVEDCTDVYAMHIYRMRPDEVADFRTITGKPKWVLELGAYNFYDPDAVQHPTRAANELYQTDENYIAVKSISSALLDEGFTLIMPWGFTGNSGMVVHNADGTHTLLKLPLWMRSELTRT